MTDSASTKLAAELGSVQRVEASEGSTRMLQLMPDASISHSVLSHSSQRYGFGFALIPAEPASKNALSHLRISQ